MPIWKWRLFIVSGLQSNVHIVRVQVYRNELLAYIAHNNPLDYVGGLRHTPWCRRSASWYE